MKGKQHAMTDKGNQLPIINNALKIFWYLWKKEEEIHLPNLES
jgi:hypothetical protein